MLRILHGSDMQVGRPFRPRAAEAFRVLAFDVEPHLIVVSGDVTQRARGREFRAAWEFLKRLPDVPLIVTPGNHDVPLFRIWERITFPYWVWRRNIPRDLDSVARVAGAVIVGLNSAAPWRAIVNGRISRGQLAFARKGFESGSPGGIRVLVIHHHFVRSSAGAGASPLPGAKRILKHIEDMGVDVVLGGHLHEMHISNSRDLVQGEGSGVPLLAVGTTTSRRGRGAEAGLCGANVVEILDDHIDVTPYLFKSRGKAFEPGDPVRLPRAGAPELTRVSQPAGVAGDGVSL